MKIRFRPSLQLLAKTRIALRFLLKIDCRIVCTNFPGALGGMESIYVAYMHQCEHCLPLEVTIKRNIASIIRALATEVTRWYDCHRNLLPDASLDYWKMICWYSHGTIDYFATARALLQNENLNRRQRYILICKYCLEGEQRLSEELTADDLIFISINAGLTKDLRTWMEALRSNTTLNWKQITDQVDTGNYHTKNPRNIFSVDYLGLLYYFPKLTNAEVRYRCLYLAILHGSIRPFYLYLCFARLPDYEVDDLFNRFPLRHRYLVIENFLQWPLQCMFLSIIERFRRRIWNQIYLDLFKFILFERFERGQLEYEYLSLLKQFWAQLSENSRGLIMDDRLYARIAYVMKFNDQYNITPNLIELYIKSGEAWQDQVVLI
ncbi:uncharacterized protein TNCT_167471 [Trichonephila clavata]|uniref:Uncharacterized protein n=1 Tax=Trichonephila clavata TaxID=2740835 RepID=A0A8X6FUN0_TRICU|nr:uncharacterized protein TNCT_167471 [Trichonephila clavata]